MNQNTDPIHSSERLHSRFAAGAVATALVVEAVAGGIAAADQSSTITALGETPPPSPAPPAPADPHGRINYIDPRPTVGPVPYDAAIKRYEAAAQHGDVIKRSHEDLLQQAPPQ